MFKILSVALALAIAPLGYAMAQNVPSSQEECEKKDGMRWDSDTSTCVEK